MLCPSLQAAIIFNENLGTPLSRLNNAPTNLGNLAVGVSTVIGRVEAAVGVGDVDVFTITVPAGTQLTTMNMSQYTGDRFAYILIDEGTSFPYNAAQLNGNVDQTLFIGGAPFGTFIGNVNATYDLLSLDGIVGIGNRSVGKQPLRDFPIIPPATSPEPYETLPANTYTIYIQQLTSVTTYTLNLTVAAIPEPTSMSMVGIGALAFLFRRQRGQRTRSC